MFWLKRIALALAPLKERVIFYSAAAVSDFYLKHMAEHKIQSADGPLQLKLDVVPKLVPTLRSVWCRRIFLVTFKLETDEQILNKKVSIHLDGYKADLVIGNLLHKYKEQVLVCQRGKDPMTILLSQTEGKDLDIAIIKEVAKRHLEFIALAKNE